MWNRKVEMGDIWNFFLIQKWKNALIKPIICKTKSLKGIKVEEEGCNVDKYVPFIEVKKGNMTKCFIGGGSHTSATLSMPMSHCESEG